MIRPMKMDNKPFHRSRKCATTRVAVLPTIPARKTVVTAALLALLLAVLMLTASPAHAEPLLSRGQLIYVPAYSHIYHGVKGKPFQLAVTLSVRNVSSTAPITVESVDYQDNGKVVRRYLDKPRTIAPLSAAEFLVTETDTSGGSDAAFLVRWAAGGPVLPPLAETVMIGTAGTQGLSFTSRGVVVEELGAR